MGLVRLSRGNFIVPIPDLCTLTYFDIKYVASFKIVPETKLTGVRFTL